MNVKRFVYYDKKSGKPVGIGEEIEVPQGKQGGMEVSVVTRAGAGGLSPDKIEVDEELYREINDPKKNRWLKDLRVKNGKVDKA